MTIDMPNDNAMAGVRLRVSVRDDEVVLNDFHETDPEVLNLARQADDPEAAMHNACQVGARAIKLAQVSQDTHVVETAFHEMEAHFDEKLQNTLGQVSQAADALFGEDDGAVPHALKDFQHELDDLLGGAFDPESKKSIIGKFDQLIHDLGTTERNAMRDLLDPGNESSPLRRLDRDLTKAVRDEADRTRKLVSELSARIAVSEAEADLYDKTAIKGRTFEELLHAHVCRLVVPFGDSAEQTGDETGCAGTKKGDEVVTINRDDTNGAYLRYTLEAKDRKVGLKAIHAELDDSMHNREAGAGIAVFSSQASAPSAVPFSCRSNKAIVVLDKHDPNPYALQLATMWARWVVRRETADDERDVDITAIGGLIDEAAKALARHATIKGCHSTAAKKIAEAGTQVDLLVSELRDVLDRLRAEVAG